MTSKVELYELSADEELMATLSVRTQIVEFLKTIKDAGTNVDTSDWREDVSECRVTIDGIQFQIVVNAIDEAIT